MSNILTIALMILVLALPEIIKFCRIKHFKYLDKKAEKYE